MSVYEQAVNDTKKYVEIAEERAKTSLLRSVMPQIRQLIEAEIVGADQPEFADDLDVKLTEPDSSGNVVLTVTPAVDTSTLTQQPVIPNTEQITVPIIPSAPPPSMPPSTVEGEDDDDENILTDEESLSELENAVTEACAKANRMLNAKIAKKSSAFAAHLQELKAHMADMYTQISANDAKNDATKKRLSEALKNSLAQLAVGEIVMAKTLRENDISLKLTGMPDDVNFDDVGVEIETDSDASSDEESSEDTGADTSADTESDEETLDFSSEEGDDSEDEEEEKNETIKLDTDDDEMIEIDESEIRAELSRMRAVREAEARPDNRGMGPGDADSFGDGEEEGDPLTDIDVMSERSVSKLRSVKQEALRKGNIKLYRECRARIESLSRVSPISRDRARPANIAAKRVSSASRHLSEARTQLAEANLNNAQLAYANKLLLRGDLSNSQKRDSLARLSRAKTVREVKVIFESVVSLLDSRSTLSESRTMHRHNGAASRTTGSSSSTITESVDAARWSLLAGLNS